MEARRKTRTKRNEAGIALLISIFILLLISVVAIALIVSSSTESSLAGNYRSSTGVNYAASAGLEEARGRLLAKDPNSFRNTAPGFLPSPGNTLAIGAVAYVLNPGPTDAPGTLLATYPDAEYDTEFGAGALGAATVTTTASVWNRSPLNTLAFPAPLYKWARINAVSEKSLNIDVDADGLADSTTPLYYDGAHFSNNSSVGAQVMEITSLAVLPNGSQKLLQYVAAPAPLNLPNFLATITLAGNTANTLFANSLDYGGPNSNSFFVDGTDSFHNSFGSCTPGGTPVYALGYTNNLDHTYANIDCCKVTSHPANYIGKGGATPNIGLVSMPVTLQTPTDYNNLVQAITKVNDVLLGPNPGPSPPPISGAQLSAATSGMSATNPLTIVINGDLDLTGWHNQGYGLLLVTGNLTYDPDASWYGIVLVIGKGVVTGDHLGSGEIDGATLLAQTVDPSTGAPLAALGPAYMRYTDPMGGIGHYYSSCWIKNSIPSGPYKILSFHEISQ